MNKTSITITTINVPKILEDLCKNLTKYNHLEDVSVLVIGDKKTPAETRDYCLKIAKEFNTDIEYLGIEDQEKAFKENKELLNLFPYNTPDRVMLGGMLSYLRGCERLIALDDDNFPTEYDFVGSHSITGKEEEIKLIKNESGWFNVHNALIDERNIPFYPRGFPWGQRNSGSDEKTFQEEKRRVVANQGLVLEDPDIDAITRLAWPIRAIKMREEFGLQFGLYPGVWSPFNYQNTCLVRELIPVYYRPISTKRNADIWTAYLINKLAGHFGDIITFGQPLVKQIRNKHDLWDDLDIELVNNKAADYLITILRNVNLTEKTYFGALGELLNNSQEEIKKMNDISSSELEMIKGFFEEYQVWYKIVSKIINK
ncbi:hypothetical protein ACFLYY_01290 [Patescibacteria group bacterium]